MSKYIIANIAVFFYVYSVQFALSPMGVGTRAWIGIAGFLLFIYSAFKSNRFVIYKDSSYIVITLLLIGLISLLSVTINNTKDLQFITYIPSVILVFSGAYAVCRTIPLSSVGTFSILSGILVNVVGAQALISLAMFIWPEFGSKLKNLQFETDLVADILNETEGFRISGFGARFFGAGLANCLALISICLILITERLNKARMAYLAAMFLLISTIGTMMSRTTLVGIILSLGLMLPVIFLRRGVFVRNRAVKSQVAFFLITIFSMPMLFFSIFSSIFSDILREYEELIRFGFEIFFNYYEKGSAESESTNQLLDMYSGLAEFPYLIGDGLYADPSNPDKYYKGVDIGYARLIYYFGIPGLVTFLLYQYVLIGLASKSIDPRLRKIFVIAFGAFIFFTNLKGFSDITVFAAYIMIGHNLLAANRLQKSTN